MLAYLLLRTATNKAAERRNTFRNAIRHPRFLDVQAQTERGLPFTPKPLAKTPRRGTPRTTRFDELSPLVRRGRIFHVELSEKADVAAAIVRSAHPLPVECLGDASPSTEDASPVPSSQVQSNPVGLTGAYFRGPASPPSSARPRARPHLRPHDRPSTSTRKSTCSSTRRLTWMSTWLHPRCAVSKIRGFH